jgi:hypothetical protein
MKKQAVHPFFNVEIEGDIKTYSWITGDIRKTPLKAFPICIIIIGILVWFEYSIIKFAVTDWKNSGFDLWLIALTGFAVIGAFVLLSFILVFLGVIISLFTGIRPAKLVLSPGMVTYAYGSVEPLGSEEMKKRLARERFALGRKYKQLSRGVEVPQISNVKLEPLDSGKRLTFDMGSERIEIGKGLTESQKEQIFQALSSHVGLNI